MLLSLYLLQIKFICMRKFSPAPEVIPKIIYLTDPHHLSYTMEQGNRSNAIAFSILHKPQISCVSTNSL